MNLSKLYSININYLLFAIALIALSCAEEDPNLVNPPLPSETVRIRLFNYGSDAQSRKLSIDQIVSPETSYGGLSSAVTPPSADSVTLSTIVGNSIEYTDSTRLRLWRDARYIIFALPKPGSDAPVDTLIKTQTAFATLSDTTKCYISMININSEAEYRYSLVVGCPNGVTAFPAIAYMNRSVELAVNSGNYPVSIIRLDKDNNRTSLGLFDLQLKPMADYLFVVMGNNPDQIKLINRRDDGPGAMTSINTISSTIAKIRTINFSASGISATKEPDNNFLPSLASMKISDYNDVTACSSDDLDSIVVKVNSKYASHSELGLVVNFKYSLLVFDSAGKAANRSMTIPNLQNVNYPANHAAIRVVHSAEGVDAFSMSLGARDDMNSSAGYKAGEQLATNIMYGKVGTQVFALSGRAPISIFSATSPQKLIGSFIGRFEAGKNYLVVVTGKDEDELKVSIINEDEVNGNIKYLDEGIYSQIAHFVPERDTIRIKVDNVLTNAKIFYSNSMATVLPLGSVSMSSEGANYTFTTQKDYRDLLVVAGSKESPEIKHVHTIRMAYNDGLYNRRVFNAAKDMPLVTVYDVDYTNDSNASPIVVDLPYGKASDPQSVYLERKFSYYFYDKINGELFKQVNDIAMAFGKNYTIVFGGNNKVISNDTKQYNYSILLIQEY